jgi:hypothetical protein
MMDSYLARIYRRSKDDPDEIVGIIEEIDTGKKHSFKNVSELNTIITKPARRKRNRKTGNKEGRGS